MCGIVGYAGAKNGISAVIDGLYSLEYRGYDSAGISFLEEGKIRTVRSAGKVARLEERVKKEAADAHPSVAVGHTRWATHGAPTDENAHPHGNERVRLVHNGIIENYAELKAELLSRGYTFRSETDTEVAALLLDACYLETKDPSRAVRMAVGRIRGSFAFAILFAGEEGAIYAIRRASPLTVGLGEGESFVASDLSATHSRAKSYILPEEDVLVKVEATGARFWDESGKEIFPPVLVAKGNAERVEKGDFPHYMKKEIWEEPLALRRTFATCVRDGLPFFEGVDEKRLLEAERITAVACGTALHAGMLACRAFAKYCRLPARAEIASEFRYGDPILTKKDVVILVSQSGETADTLAALRLAKARGAYTVGVVNAVGSTLATESDAVIYTAAGPEISVASTKAYVVQAVLLSLLAVDLGQRRGTLGKDEAARATAHFTEELVRAVEAVLAMEDEIARAARRFTEGADRLFFIGRNADSDAAMEASLKLKEISYIQSEAYAAGELKHGTISLIEEGTPVVAISTVGALAEKLCSNVKEVASRGARVLAVVRAEDTLFAPVADEVLRLPPVGEEAAPIAAGAALQLFAYHAAVLRGCPVDQPRNLAKSVTVE